MEKKMFRVVVTYMFRPYQEMIPFVHHVLAVDEESALELLIGSRVHNNWLRDHGKHIGRNLEYLTYYDVADAGDGVTHDSNLISARFDHEFIERWRGASCTNLHKRWKPEYKKGGGD